MAYEHEATAAGIALDSGRYRRNHSAFLYLTALEAAGVFPRRPRLLDFGGGSGLLTEMFSSAGYDAYQSDLYNGTPMFAPERRIREMWSPRLRPFDVIIMLEVLEHLVSPIDLMRRITGLLKPTGALVISTEIYRTGEHTAAWPYLAPLGGQHVTFWSIEALHILRRELGFESLGYFPGRSGFLLLFTHESETTLAGKLAEAHQHLCDPLHAGRALAALDFRSDNIVVGGFGIL
jgi:hypothetical protein